MGLERSTVRLLVLSIFYIVYLVIGASVFSAIEGPQESTLVRRLQDLRSTFYRDHAQCLNDEELEEFIRLVVDAAKRGVSAVRNVTMSESNWSFGQALFFSTTTLTTIGYGRVTPLSDAGKGFCVLFAIIGIPLTLILFTALVERLMVPTKLLLYALYQHLGHLYKVFHIQLLHLCIVTCFLFIFFFLIPAAIYTALEPTWNYLDSLYYVFISLTTIGLGDFVPGENPNQQYRVLYKVCTTCYLVMGLLMMMLTLSVLYEIPELNLGLHFYMQPGDAGSQVRSEQARLKPAAASKPQNYTSQPETEEARATETEAPSYQGTEQLVPGL